MEPCDWLSKIPDTDVSVCVIIPESRKNSVKENLSHPPPKQNITNTGLHSSLFFLDQWFSFLGLDAPGGVVGAYQISYLSDVRITIPKISKIRVMNYQGNGFMVGGQHNRKSIHLVSGWPWRDGKPMEVESLGVRGCCEQWKHHLPGRRVRGRANGAGVSKS